MRALLAAVLLTCCTASVTGEPFGKPFGAASAVARRGTNSINSSYTISISNLDANCDAEDGGVDPDGTQFLSIVIARNGAELPVSRGEPYLQSGSAEFSTLYGCQVTAGRCRLAPFADSSVKLTKVADGKVEGSFEALFNVDQKVSGTFDALLCL